MARRPSPSPGSPPALECRQVREAVSAGLDGEEHPWSVALLDAHLAACRDCRNFRVTATDTLRWTRVGAAAQVPDLTERILTALPEGGSHARRLRLRGLRVLVALAGTVQLVLALPVLAGVLGPSLHAGRELGSLQFALGVGFLFAAHQPRRAPGVLPIAVVVAFAAVAIASLDVLRGATAPLAELTHLTEVVGVLGLRALAGRPDAGAPPAARLAPGPPDVRARSASTS